MTPRLPDPLALLDRLGACREGRDLVDRCWPGATWKMLWHAVTNGSAPNADSALWFARKLGIDLNVRCRAEDVALAEHVCGRGDCERQMAPVIGRLIPYSLIEERLIAIAKEMNGG